MSNDTERRQKSGRAAAIEHAIGLKSTHGVSYASKYLQNQKVADETIARVLTDDTRTRRAVSRWVQVSSLRPDREFEQRTASTRQLSYQTRGRLTHNR